jgi:chorismate mutase
MPLRGVRGAISVENNTKEEIVAATKKLLNELINANYINKREIASIFFTVTADLNAEFPAVAARELGYTFTPLMCSVEIPVSGALPKIIRVLIHFNTDIFQENVKPLYLGEAKNLRPDQ